MMNIQDFIKNGFEQMKIPHESESAQKMTDFLTLLLEKNQVMNLTAITEPLEAAEKHMLDCSAIASYIDLNEKNLIDIGCGAGFPGLPLKFLNATCHVTLLDSQKKRLDFIEEALKKMAETVPPMIHSRAEDAAANPALREHFDVCTSRAVAHLNILAELCLPFLKTGGMFIAMKSVACDDEIAECKHALTILGGSLSAVQDYCLPSGISHRLVMIRKEKSTSKQYPRKFSQIKKAPL